jgi:hypothetical protein
MMAYDDDAYQNCKPDYPRECNKLEKDKPRILRGVMKGNDKIYDTTRNLWRRRLR